MSDWQHSATAGFWRAYAALPQEWQQRADKQVALPAENPQHASLHFKKVGERNGHAL